MSQYPYNTPYNLNYGGNVPAPSARPAMVSGLAITGIVMASLGILCRGFNGITALIMLGNGGKNMFAPNAPAIHDLTYHRAAAAGSIIELLFYLVLLIACIASLSLKPWARKTLIGWSLGMIVWQVVWCAIEFVVLLPPTMQMMKDIQRSQPNNVAAGQVQGIMQGAMVGGYIFWLLFSIVLPILFLSMWTRASVKSAFSPQQNQGQVPPQQFPSNFPAQ